MSKYDFEQFDVIDLSEFELLCTYMMDLSNLPGPRGNLEMIHEFSKYIEMQPKTESLFDLLLRLWGTDSDGDNPETILTLSGLIAVSNYCEIVEFEHRVLNVITEAMNDTRWRVREIVQESLKIIAHFDYTYLISYFDSFKSPTVLEWRAMITTLAHPEILKTPLQISYALGMLEKTFDAYKEFEVTEDKNDASFVAFIKGLMFAPSVIVSVAPDKGFKILENSINHSKKMNQIIKSNLKKNRVVKNNEARCNELLLMMS